MRKHIFKFSIGLIFTFLFPSCEKVIDINLNSSEPKIIIESNVTDQPGPYAVKLSQTVNFGESNIFPPVSAAAVRISDDTGNAETLTETIPGIYSSATIQGTPGTAYTLEVTVNGKTYKAVSIMPKPVNIDSLIVESSSSMGPREKNQIVNVQYTDPLGKGNYYRFILLINGKVQNDIFIDNDELQDGEIKNCRLTRGTNNTKLNPGDSVTVLLQTIDKGVYEYFRTLSQIVGSDGGLMRQSTSPSNPISNFSNGTLGYFSAYGLTSKTIVI